MDKILVWDMDGTIANLYDVPFWCAMLDSKNPLPYSICSPMWDMAELAEVLTSLRSEGWKIEIAMFCAIQRAFKIKKIWSNVNFKWGINPYFFMFFGCFYMQR